MIHQQTEAQRLSIQAQALAQKRQIEAYTYQQEKAYEVAERLAENDGIGSLSNTGIGLGMVGGLAGGIGAAMGKLASEAFAPIKQQSAESVDDCSQTAPPDESLSPADTSAALADFEFRIKKLELLKEKIPEDIYQAKLQEILDSI